MSVVRAVVCCTVLVSTSCVEPPWPPLEAPPHAELASVWQEKISSGSAKAPLSAEVRGNHAQDGLPEAEEAEPERPEVESVNVRAMLAQMERRRWRAPEDPAELEEASAAALFSVCIGEEGWANPIGCKAIWQVAWTIRGCVDAEGYQRSCRDSRATRQRESRLSALRRMSPRHTGAQPPRTERQRWTSTLTLDCAEPSGWPRTTAGGDPYAQWISYQPLCEALAVEARRIVAGEDALVACPANSRPISWGCEPLRRLALREVLGRSRPMTGCSDRWMAERRQLVRLDCGETEDAYYCRPGTPSCGTLPASERELLARSGLDWSVSALPTAEEVIDALRLRESGALATSVP